MAQELLLVRHATTASEYSGRYVGAVDAPLGAEGIAQARRLALGVAGRKPARCYCSPLSRTRETARFLAEAAGIPIELEADLREVDFGKWEGMTFAQVAALNPETVGQWACFSEDFAFPGGESIRDFLARVRSVSKRLIADPAERILVVTHGGVIRCMICHLLGLDPRNYLLFEVRCAAVTTIKIFDGKGILAGMNEGN